MLDLSKEKTLEFMNMVSKFLEENTDCRFVSLHEAVTDSKGCYRISVFVTDGSYQHGDLEYIAELKRYYEGRPGWDDGGLHSE